MVILVILSSRFLLPKSGAFWSSPFSFNPNSVLFKPSIIGERGAEKKSLYTDWQLLPIIKNTNFLSLSNFFRLNHKISRILVCVHHEPTIRICTNYHQLPKQFRLIHHHKQHHLSLSSKSHITNMVSQVQWQHNKSEPDSSCKFTVPKWTTTVKWRRGSEPQKEVKREDSNELDWARPCRSEPKQWGKEGICSCFSFSESSFVDLGLFGVCLWKLSWFSKRMKKRMFKNVKSFWFGGVLKLRRGGATTGHRAGNLSLAGEDDKQWRRSFISVERRQRASRLERGLRI